MQPQEEAGGPTGRGQKRSDEDPSEEAAANKRICFDQRERSRSAELVSSTDQEEVMDVEENETENRLSGLKKWTDPKQTRDCDEDLDEDVDVGGLSPAPDLVIIDWPEFFEGEEEEGEEDLEDLEVDVVGER